MIASCGDVECVRPGACFDGANVTAWDTTSELCFQSGRRSCPAGAVCDLSGSCVFADDGLPCTVGVECGTGNCWRPPASPAVGVCCNSKCDNECQECLSVRGVCMSRTGAACSMQMPCDTVSHALNHPVSQFFLHPGFERIYQFQRVPEVCKRPVWRLHEYCMSAWIVLYPPYTRHCRVFAVSCFPHVLGLV